MRAAHSNSYHVLIIEKEISRHKDWLLRNCNENAQVNINEGIEDVKSSIETDKDGTCCRYIK